MSNFLNIPRVVFSVTNCICHDQRVLKMAETVSGLNCEITIVGRKRGDCCDSDSVPFKTKRFRMLFKRGFLFYKFFNIRLFFYLLFHRYDLLVSNDLDTLLPNFIVSKLKRIPLVYDSHEYFTGVPEIQNRPFVKWVWKCIEKMIFPHLKYIITVNDSIANLYKDEYGTRPAVVRNCSPTANSVVPYSRKELGIPEEHLLLIFQGTGINVNRGGEELIEALKSIDKVFLLIVGGGDKLEILKSRVRDLDINERVKFIPIVSWKELIKYTKSADAGLTIDKDSNTNYRYSLPNKLFDYITAGIAIIASDLPETSKILNEYYCGLIIDEVTPKKISFAISQLKDNPFKLAEMKRNALLASARFNWETESEKVKELYKKALSFYYNE